MSWATQYDQLGRKQKDTDNTDRGRITLSMAAVVLY